jgi:hypothetical protein
LVAKPTTNFFRQILVIVATLATIIVNVLANALPINDLTTGEVSARYQAAFTPANYVFSIWGLIYLGLLAYTVYQALPAQRDDPRLRSIDGPYLVAAAANITWILLWHHELIVASVVVMFVLLASLITIYLRLDVGRSGAPLGHRLVVETTFSVYLAWITVAALANLGAMAVFLGWTGAGLGGPLWFAVAVAVALVAAGLVAWTRADLAYLAVFLWAFIGLGVRHLGAPAFSTAAWIGTAVVVGLIALSVIRPKPAP